MTNEKKMTKLCKRLTWCETYISNDATKTKKFPYFQLSFFPSEELYNERIRINREYLDIFLFKSAQCESSPCMPTATHITCHWSYFFMFFEDLFRFSFLPFRLLLFLPSSGPCPSPDFIWFHSTILSSSSYPHPFFLLLLPHLHPFLFLLLFSLVRSTLPPLSTSASSSSILLQSYTFAKFFE